MMQEPTVADRSDAVERMAEPWPMVSALMAGTGAMRAAGKAFLPQFPKEDSGSYKMRLNRAVLLPIFRRTVLVNAAKPFSKPPTIQQTGVPEEWLDDMDLQGSSLASFGKGIMIQLLAYGIAGVLVDYPRAEGVVTKAQEKQAGVRPYCALYQPQQILGWKLSGTGPAAKLSQLRLLEMATVDNGPWATTSVPQVRVLTPGQWQTYRQDARDATKWVLFEQGTTTLQEIPFVFFHGVRSGEISASPLLDLAYLNVEHWQSYSDQQNILHVARVPILVARGFGDTPITVGVNSAISTDNAQASLTYTEHTGAAIEAGRQDILDLEDRMRAIGAEMVMEKTVQATATQIGFEGDASKSTLQMLTEEFEEGLERCVELMAAWVKADIEIEISLYKDFASSYDADPQTLAIATGAGVISRRTMFEELQRRDVISLDRTWEEELDRIQLEPGAPDMSGHASGLNTANGAVASAASGGGKGIPDDNKSPNWS